MTSLLRIDSSPRIDGSHSRAIADLVEQEMLSINPATKVVKRDVSQSNLPAISDQTIAGFFTPIDDFTPELTAATALSDELIGELKAADTLLISAPLYNFGVPSSLKAWVDQVSRVGHTFSFDGESFAGLVPTKSAILALAYGGEGYTNDGPMAAMNFMEPYLVSLLHFLGIESVHVFRIEGTSIRTPESLAEETTLLKSEIQQTLNPYSQEVQAHEAVTEL